MLAGPKICTAKKKEEKRGPYTVESAPAVIGSVFMRNFRLFLGTVYLCTMYVAVFQILYLLQASAVSVQYLYVRTISVN